jgi:zinc transporter 9
VLEGYTLYVAYRECARAAAEHGISVKDYVVNSQDVSTIAVLMEDSAAVLGVGIAGSILGMGIVF